MFVPTSTFATWKKKTLWNKYWWLILWIIREKWFGIKTDVGPDELQREKSLE